MIKPPSTWHNEKDHRRRLGDAISEVIDGHGNNAGTVTLTANQATTAVTDTRVGTDSVIALMPTTASAATEFGAGSIYVSARGDGTFTLTHVNSATADRTFEYAILATGYST